MRSSGLRRGLAATLVGLTVAGCSSATSSSTPPNVVPTRPTSPVGARVPFPVGLATVGNTVWAVSPNAGTVSPLVAGAAATPGSVHVGKTPLRATYFHHLLWVTVFGAGQVVSVDPKTSKVVRRVKVSGQPEGIVGAAGEIWVVRQAARQLTAITPAGKVDRSIPLGKEPRLVTAGGSALFVSNFGDGTVTRVEPRSGTSATSHHLCQGAQGLAVERQTLWVTCTPAGEVLAVDVKTLRPTGKLEIDDEPDAIQVSNGSLYVASTKGPTLHRISPDPQHPKLLQSQVLGSQLPLFDRANVDLAIIGDQLWVSSPSANRVFRLQL